MADETRPDTLLSDEEVSLLNEARTLLETYADRCTKQSFDTPPGYNGGAANAADYGRVDALAHAAADSIFDVLNWSCSYGVRDLTETQLHNKPAHAVEPIIPPALVAVGHEDYPEARE